MEHLVRNTNNDRIVNTIKTIQIENNTIKNKELISLLDKVVTACTGILSSVISAIIMALLKKESSINSMWFLSAVIFLALLIFLWFILGKFVIPKLNIVFFKEKISLQERKKDVVQQFNCEIMQKLAEVNEIVGVILETKIAECKMLNLT